MRPKKSLIVIASGVAALCIGGGAAYAAWSASGSGSGSGAATVAQSLVVTPVTPAGANASIYPGGPAGPVFFTIQNPNPYPVNVTTLAWGTPTSTLTSQCASSNLTLDANAPTTVAISIPANTTTSTQQVNGVIDLAHAAPPGCQGVAFDIAVTVTGAQQ